MRADPEARCIKINTCIPVPLAKYQNRINTARCLSVNHDSNALKCDGVDTAPVSEPDKLGPMPMCADPEAEIFRKKEPGQIQNHTKFKIRSIKTIHVLNKLRHEKVRKQKQQLKSYTRICRVVSFENVSPSDPHVSVRIV